MLFLIYHDALIYRKEIYGVFVNFDKNNSELKIKIADIKKKLDKGMPTVPSTIKEELDCNIFLRAKNLKEFSKLRDLKDNF